MSRCFTLKVKYKDGEKIRSRYWEFWNDCQGWHIETHDRCRRFVGKTWKIAVPEINKIAENYGMDTPIVS